MKPKRSIKYLKNTDVHISCRMLRIACEYINIQILTSIPETDYFIYSKIGIGENEFYKRIKKLEQYGLVKKSNKNNKIIKGLFANRVLNFCKDLQPKIKKTIQK